MSASNPQHEPTMEEILASIRKIISEDQPEQEKPKAEGAASDAPPAFEAEVFELTEEIKDDGSVSAAAAAPGPAASKIPSSRAFDNDVAFENIDEPPESQAVSAALDDDDADDLISDSARSAVGRVFETLDESPSRTMSRPSGNSVEAVFQRAIQESFEPTLQKWVDANSSEVMQALKPIIREWMDDNLPPLIEAAVQKEIARAVKIRRR
jgi:cell pole-organizing protein PopZ